MALCCIKSIVEANVALHRIMLRGHCIYIYCIGKGRRKKGKSSVILTETVEPSPLFFGQVFLPKKCLKIKKKQGSLSLPLIYIALLRWLNCITLH